MDNIQTYFVTTIVGAPRRLVLGRHLRYDLDPKAAIPVAKEGAWGRVVDQFHSLVEHLPQFRVKRRSVSAPVAVALAQVDTGIVATNAQSKPSNIGGSNVNGLTLVAWLVPAFAFCCLVAYVASGWYEEFNVAMSANAEQKPHPVVQTGTPPSPAASSAIVESAALPMERSTSATWTAPAEGGVTIVDAPAPTPVPLEIIQKQGHPLDRTVQTVKLTPAPSPQQQAPSKQVADRPKEEKPEVQERAVIVDVTKGPEEVKAPASPTPVSPVPPKQATQNVDKDAPVIRRFAQPEEVKPGQAKPEPAPAKVKPSEKVTIVDIAPDSSYVLISNPQTRLPQRYTVGQKIFTGETIKSIDPKTGIVNFDNRTVPME